MLVSPRRYFIDRHTDLERQFNINVDDGKITLAKPLDRETDMWHNITVTATEVGEYLPLAPLSLAVHIVPHELQCPVSQQTVRHPLACKIWNCRKTRGFLLPLTDFMSPLSQRSQWAASHSAPPLNS